MRRARVSSLTLLPKTYEVLTHLHRHLREINYSSFRNAAIEKVTFGLTTVQEIKRVLPRSALFDNKNNVWRSHLVTT